MRHNVNLPSVLVWIIYPVAFTLFIIFCFMTCDSKPLGRKDAKPAIQKDTSSLIMTLIPDNVKQPDGRAAYWMYKPMPDDTHWSPGCSHWLHIPAEYPRLTSYFSPGQRLGTADTQCLISL